MKELKDRISQWPLELIFWIGCILSILTINTEVKAFSLCLLHQLGLASGEFQASWQHHPAAGLAYGVIFHRIWVLVKQLKHHTHYG